MQRVHSDIQHVHQVSSKPLHGSCTQYVMVKYPSTLGGAKKKRTQMHICLWVAKFVFRRNPDHSSQYLYSLQHLSLPAWLSDGCFDSLTCGRVLQREGVHKHLAGLDDKIASASASAAASAAAEGAPTMSTRKARKRKGNDTLTGSKESNNIFSQTHRSSRCRLDHATPRYLRTRKAPRLTAGQAPADSSEQAPETAQGHTDHQ